MIIKLTEDALIDGKVRVKGEVVNSKTNNGHTLLRTDAQLEEEREQKRRRRRRYRRRRRQP